MSMNKREFLALGGAVPLMLAGCGGGRGHAPVRLVNASVGYSELGFMVESTQATSSDIAYGEASAFENVEAGSVDVTLNVSGTSISTFTRTINKGTRYSLVAYGYDNELKALLMAEDTTDPDDNKAKVTVVNTSTDIGAVDVYFSTDLSIPYANVISSVGSTSSIGSGGPLQLAAPASYYITIVGAGTVARGVSDIRFQSTTPIALTNKQIKTVILTPGASGVLANVIVLTQGTASASDATTGDTYTNATSRARVVTAVGGLTKVTGTSSDGTSTISLLDTSASATDQYSSYQVIGTGQPLAVTVNGATISVDYPVESDATTYGLEAGGDYTVMVYWGDTAKTTPKAKVILDNNTAPTSSAGMKFRLINLASNDQTQQLSMAVNSSPVASTVTYGSASTYTEITSVPQSTPSAIEILNGATTLATVSQTLTLSSNSGGNIYTAIVISTDPISKFFQSAAIPTSSS